MAANFSPAILATVRNRELLAEALESQQRSLLRRRLFFRVFFLATLASIAGYIIYQPELPDTKAMKAAAKLQKAFSQEVSKQLDKNGMIMIAGDSNRKEHPAKIAQKEEASGVSNETTSQENSDGTEDMIAELEKRNAEMKEFSDKYKGKVDHEQLQKIVKKSQSQAMSADLGKSKNSPTPEDEEAVGPTSSISNAEKGAPQRAPASQSSPTAAQNLAPITQEEIENTFPELISSPKTESSYRFATAEDLMLLLKTEKEFTQNGYIQLEKPLPHWTNPVAR